MQNLQMKSPSGTSPPEGPEGEGDSDPEDPAPAHDLLQLILRMLDLDPNTRPTSAELVNQPCLVRGAKRLHYTQKNRKPANLRRLQIPTASSAAAGAAAPSNIFSVSTSPDHACDPNIPSPSSGADVSSSSFVSLSLQVPGAHSEGQTCVSPAGAGKRVSAECSERTDESTVTTPLSILSPTSPNTAQFLSPQSASMNLERRQKRFQLETDKDGATHFPPLQVPGTPMLSTAKEHVQQGGKLVALWTKNGSVERSMSIKEDSEQSWNSRVT